MRLLRFIATEKNQLSERPVFGFIDDDETFITELSSDDPFVELADFMRRVADGRVGSGDQASAVKAAVRGLERTGRTFALEEVRLLAPVDKPSKIVGIGKNYAEHIREFDSKTPEEPLLFLKPSTALIGPGDPIILPRWSEKVDHEAELGVVVGKTAKNVSVDEALNYILGYTVGNDVSARDMQKRDGQWTRAKGFDTACPLGPWITIDGALDPTDLLVTGRVNGELKQSSSTAAMLHPVAELIAFASGVFTLLPGDVILTGTPAGVSQLHGGDSVEVAVDGVGALTNPVVK